MSSGPVCDFPPKTIPAISSASSLNKGVIQVESSAVWNDDLVDAEPKPFKFTNWLFGRTQPLDLDSIATRRSIYDDPDLGKHYWPKADYENIHRFDTKARWTWREEKALVKKLDLKVLLWAAISFSALNLDRNNLTQVNSDNFLPDLRMSTNDFNLGNSIFRIAFLCAELPSQMVSKRLGPDRWIPIQMCLWAIVTLFQFFLTGRSSFLATRALLGFLQGGFIPDLILYLSYFYTKNELPIRLSIFWISMNACSIMASFIAFGVLHMRGVAGKAGWRWLFLVEGFITLIVGLLTFFQMPPSPTQTKTWFRPKGWFTEREEIIAVNRVLRDDPTKGDMHNREGLTIKRLWTAVLDYDLWPLYIAGLMFGIPVTTPTTYLSLLLRNTGFSTFQTNLLTIPSSVAGMLTMFLITLLSESVNDRTWVASTENMWALPFLVAIYTLRDEPNQWIFFGLVSGLLSYPYTHPIQVAWCSRNSGSVASRTVNASLYNMFVQASAVIANQIYRKDDAPMYRRGNIVLISITLFNIFIMYPSIKVYYVWRNKQRENIWNSMTTREKEEYLTKTKDIGNRRLDFRFAH